MNPSDDLFRKLRTIDQKDYGAYQTLLGEYEFPGFNLLIRQIPKDPYAPPHTGLFCVRVERRRPDVINAHPDSRAGLIAFRDFLTRRFYRAAGTICQEPRGTGYSGIITISNPGQCMLERNAVIVDDRVIEVRCFIGLPAKGRTIDTPLAIKMLQEELPEIIQKSLFRINFKNKELDRYIETAEDAEYLRNMLGGKNLVAFIEEGAILPRISGSDDEPLPRKNAVAFQVPENFRLEVDLPHAGRITGMGIPKGITLIVGGGYHGKSTLLKALEAGVYNHIPGDGREKVVSLAGTVKIRAYSGRYITGVDISPFIRNLPFEKDTLRFSTENASGSTSQAAAIIEALEIGAEVLLMDEDTCATNFMVRDAKMQQLVAKADEPITTFIDRVRALYTERDISTILVLGGAGDYFSVADQIIQMKQYVPQDVTRKAREILHKYLSDREAEDGDYPFITHNRVPVEESIDALNAYGKKAIYSTNKNRLNFGKQQIDLSDLEQLLELSQTKAIGFALEYAKRYMDGNRTLYEIVEQVVRDINQSGLDVISDRVNGNFAGFRSFELAFALNRLRGLQVVEKP
jgi:predicted ABC-class ATPase